MMPQLRKNILLIQITITFLSIALFSKLGWTQPLNPLTWKTKNGAQVIFYPMKDIPILDIRLAFAAGSAYDDKLYGVSQLTTQLLDKGDAGIESTTIAEKLSETGAQYSAVNNQNMILLSLRTLTENEDLEQSSQIFASIVSHPDFPEQAFQQEKNQQLLSIAEEQDSPTELANQTFYRFLYQSAPYAHPISGYADTVNQLTLDEVREFYHRYFVGHNALLVLVGAITEKKAHRLAEQILKDLPPGEAALPLIENQALKEGIDVEIPLSTSQTVLRLGQLGISPNDKEYFPLLVGNYILGGSPLTSRLALALREQNGLTYGVTSKFLPMPGKGPFIIGLSTEHHQIKTTLELTRQILVHFLQEGPTENELRTAKQFLIGNFQLSLSSHRNITDTLLKIAFYHLPDDYLETYVSKINEVQIKDIQSAFKALIHPDQFLLITVGNPPS